MILFRHLCKRYGEHKLKNALNVQTRMHTGMFDFSAPDRHKTSRNQVNSFYTIIGDE